MPRARRMLDLCKLARRGSAWDSEASSGEPPLPQPHVKTVIRREQDAFCWTFNTTSFSFLLLLTTLPPPAHRGPRAAFLSRIVAPRSSPLAPLIASSHRVFASLTRSSRTHARISSHHAYSILRWPPYELWSVRSVTAVAGAGITLGRVPLT